MKRLVAATVVLGLIAVALVFPTPAFAHHGGRFFGGFVAGAFTGAIVGHVLAPPVIYAAPPAPVYYPAPVYSAPPVYYPATTCYDSWVGGYWYYGTWVPGYWQRACR